MGQQVTWLVPHQLAQVLPQDVDYRVMLTFLEFYSVMLEFVLYKLYSAAGARYPPQVFCPDACLGPATMHWLRASAAWVVEVIPHDRISKSSDFACRLARGEPPHAPCCCVASIPDVSCGG